MKFASMFVSSGVNNIISVTTALDDYLEMLMSLSSKSILINNRNVAFANVLCAVRNGQTGERFRKKSIMSLGRSGLPGTLFLALNDIVSSSKRFGIITFAFFLCLSLLLILSSTASTMKSGTFAGVLGFADFNLSAKGRGAEFMTEDGHEKLKANIGDAITIKTTDVPDQKEIACRMEKIQELYPGLDGVRNRAECISDELTVTDTVDMVKRMVVVLAVILAALITVLIERSFIAREQGEIALMKAIGTRNGKIYAHHTLRFVFVGIIVIITAELFALPLTDLFIDSVFKMMGMEASVDYVTSPFEMFLVFPLVILAATTTCAFLTSLCAKK